MTTGHTVAVAGGRLHCEVRGSGPLLLLVGAPMAAAPFRPLAEVLAADHTVVTHDPRGIAASVLDDPEQDSTPELRADDVAALLDALGADSADVFGSSGGAVTGLALVARHPHRVRTLVAHEPPVMELLPDAEVHRAAMDEIVATFERDGLEAAFARFARHAGFAQGDAADAVAADAPTAPHSEPSAQERADGARFFAHELRGTARYLPDLAALRRGPARVVVGIGADSGGLVTYPTSMALAERLGVEAVQFPGAHVGFVADPVGFATVLRAVLAGG